MTSSEKAIAFAALHTPGRPLVLYNIWDAGLARALAEAGAPAVATGSWSVAAAQGYPDGQKIPFDLLLTLVRRIVASVEVPVSIDFEGAYAEAPAEVEANTGRLIAAGAVGANFEDRKVGGKGLHGVEAHARRVAAMRRAGVEAGSPFFINARTDLFLREKNAEAHGGLIDEALERAAAYAEAGASGFFAPGLRAPELIARLVESSPLPVNVMATPAAPPAAALAKLGVARISHGPFPYRQAQAALVEHYRALQ